MSSGQELSDAYEGAVHVADANRVLYDPSMRGQHVAPMTVRGLLAEIDRLAAGLSAAREEAQKLREQRDDARDVLAREQQRHATMRTALSFVRRWPDGVTGKGMVDAEDILTILDADCPPVAAGVGLREPQEEK